MYNWKQAITNVVGRGEGCVTMHIGLFLLLGENSMLVIILLWPDVLSLPQSLDTVKAHRQLEVSYDENILALMKIYELWWKYMGFDENIWAMMKIYELWWKNIADDVDKKTLPKKFKPSPLSF